MCLKPALAIFRGALRESTLGALPQHAQTLTRIPMRIDPLREAGDGSAVRTPQRTRRTGIAGRPRQRVRFLLGVSAPPAATEGACRRPAPLSPYLALFLLFAPPRLHRLLRDRFAPRRAECFRAPLATDQTCVSPDFALLLGGQLLCACLTSKAAKGHRGRILSRHATSLA
jgi:hypothetical protein